MWASVVGTRESNRAQFARLAAPSSGRSFELHRDEMSAKEPLVRINPPSEPSKICVGLDGLTAITCWSGWIEPGAQRHWNGAVTPPNANCALPSAHQSAGVFSLSTVRSLNVRLSAGPVAEASGSPAVVE